MSESSNITSNTALNGNTDLEFLAFKLGEEEYGIEIEKVQELRRYEKVTYVANSPAHVMGVVNLRGIIVPIIDMRIKYKLGTPSYGEFTVVVILNLIGQLTGIVVDSVSDVITLPADQIKSAPPLDAGKDINYLIGIASMDARMLILVDIEKMMSSKESVAAQ
jgi:purine-binding chemotaxis protein CheW